MRLRPAPALAYGGHPNQVGNLHLPNGESPFPAVVLVHGGFWRAGWDRTTLTPLARDLAVRGIAAWNAEYRRVGEPGGGWPGTFQDVAAACDHVRELPEVDPDRVVAVGHSAGGHLALWLAARPRLPADAPGAAPRTRLRAAVALAAVCDLAAADRDALGGGAATDLLGGGRDEVPERYAAASPSELLPLGVPQLVVQGGRDDVVPASQGRDYAAAARAAGDDVELLELPGADHFDVIEPGSAACAAVAARLPALLGLS